MWWAVNATGNYWFTASGPNHAAMVSKYPGSSIQGPFNSKRNAQAYCDQHNPKKKGKRKKTGSIRSGAPDGSTVVANARSWLGVPYVLGGTTRKGVDCSGLVQNVAEESGVKGCPRTSEEQWAWCEHISSSEANAGDLVFFVGAPEEAGPPGHVGIIVAPSTMINAPFPGTVVRQDHFMQGPPDQNTSNENNIWGYGRLRGVNKSSSANPYVKDKYAVLPIPVGGGFLGLIILGVVVAVVIVLFLMVMGSGMLWRAG